MIANIGIAASFVFYDSLLPHIASSEEMDRVSTAAYAMGYLGGGVLLVVNLAWILSPATFGLADSVAAIRLSFVSVAVWWFVFSLPLLLSRALNRRRRLGRTRVVAITPSAWRSFVCGRPSMSSVDIARPS